MFIFIASGLTSIIKPANAQTISKPSVPEFTVEYVPFECINVTVKNQPFSSTVLPDGNVTELVYEVRLKGHYSTYWTSYGSSGFYNLRAKASGSDFTVLDVKFGEDYSYFLNNSIRLDLQVRAQVGYSYSYLYHLMPAAGYVSVMEGDWSNTQTINLYDGTVTTSLNTDPTPTPTATQTSALTATPAPSVPEFSVIALLPLFVIALLVVFVVKSKAHRLG